MRDFTAPLMNAASFANAARRIDAKPWRVVEAQHRASTMRLVDTLAEQRVLEDLLDRPVFIRNKAGAKLTPAGEQFLRFATTMVQVWDRARRAVALRRGRARCGPDWSTPDEEVPR